MRIPLSAPLPAPTNSAAGVAIPRAQGHAITITDTKARREKASPIPPMKYHRTPEVVAIRMTDGTKYADTLSASLCRGALPTWASPSGSDHKHVVNLNVLDRNLDLVTLSNDPGHRGLEFEELPNRLGRSFLSQVFEEVSGQYQSDDDR